ncbi:MAG: sigma-54-dependent transcriptional regulator [bacterium]
MIKRILIVDDEEGIRYSFKRFLNEAGYNVATARNGAEALEKYAEEPYDLVVLDICLPDISGLEVLYKIKTIDPNAIILIITAFGTTDIAIEATKKGAYDYIQKPFDILTMKSTIHQALTYSRLRYTQKTVEEIKADPKPTYTLIGNSPLMQEVYKMIGRVAMSDINILVRGESGTGKELVAWAIYKHSKRSDKAFVTVNCAAIPETLLESELFGYERGAFTGAIRRKIGKFEQATCGTIFLDEIGDMPLSIQSKLLRVLQERCFESLGGEQTIHVDVRVITATNTNLEKLIQEGQFREDLYYRLKGLTITLPPLRARKEDISQLVEYFLTTQCSVLKEGRISISKEAINRLTTYHWPGNVRELENIMKRAIVLCKGNLITEDLVMEEFQVSMQGIGPPDDGIGKYPDWKKELELYRGSLYEKVMSETEKNLIEWVLNQTEGNQVQTAKILGISRFMLRDRLMKYQLKKEIHIQ